jgi:hypothetical protein
MTNEYDRLISLIYEGLEGLFGTTTAGGAYGYGTVFEIAKTGSGYASTPTTLWSFTGGTDGGSPESHLTADTAGDLFSTTFLGGTNGDGTVFELTGAGFKVTADPPPSTTADMIMRDGTNGDYEIYDIGTNAILAAYPLVPVNIEWQIAGVGGFNGTDTSDMILRDSNNGAFEIYDISNNVMTSASSIGQVGLEWRVSGFGDFSSNANETDMLMRNSNTGAFEVYDISNNAITSAASMGAVGMDGCGLRRFQQ